MREGRAGATSRSSARCGITCCDPAGLQHRHGQRRAAEQQQGSAASTAFAARFDPAVEDDREAAIKATEEALRKAMRAVASLFEDEILRDWKTWSGPCAPTPTSARNGPCSRSGSTARGQGDALPGPCSRSTSTRESSKGSTCRRQGRARRPQLTAHHDDFPRKCSASRRPDGQELGHRPPWGPRADSC